jgi:hypothetical protein
MKAINQLLINSIKSLAFSSETQRDYLKQIGTFPSLDELALDFDDAYRPFVGELATHPSNPITLSLQKINLLLDSFSEDKTIWTEESLDNKSWTELRAIAASILRDIEQIN